MVLRRATKPEPAAKERGISQDIINFGEIVDDVMDTVRIANHFAVLFVGVSVSVVENG